MDGTPAEVVTLTCWKDIANYMGKGVRTVQRWEQEFGLPVRRPNGMSHKSPVAANPRELDAWMQSHWSLRVEREPNAPASAPANGDSQDVRHRSALLEDLRKNIRLSADLRAALQLSRQQYRETVHQVASNTISLGLKWQLSMSSPQEEKTA